MFLSYNGPNYNINSDTTSQRYIPDLRTNNIITNLGLARIEPTRAAVSEQSYNRTATDESPFNPVIYENVRYSTNPYITNRNRVVSKYENNNPGNNNIALYDTHTFSLNALNEPTMGNNQMYNNLMKRARDKVRLKETDLLPAYGPNDSTNGWIYNPELPVSPTNIIPPDGGDGFYVGNNPYSSLNLDPRLNQFTNARAWNYPSTKSDIAYDLQRANFIKERNIRQHEADDALFRRTKKDRWVEPKMAYMDRRRNPTYTLDDTIKNEASAQSSRNQPSDYKSQESFIRARNDLHKTPPLDSHEYNVRANQIYRVYNPEYVRHMDEVYMKDIPNMRQENYTEPEKHRTNLPNSLNKIGKAIQSFFGWNNDGDRRTILPDDPRGEKVITDGYYADPSAEQIDYNISNRDSKMLSSATGAKERFMYKPDHVLVIHDGKTNMTYPDNELNETATSAITQDPYRDAIVRNMCLLKDNKFILLQKYAEDSIFTGDYRKVGEDIITLELPVNSLSKKFREKLQKYNTSTDRDKVLNMTYDEFTEIIDWAEKHPEMKKRLNRDQLHLRVRVDDYDMGLINNFGTNAAVEGQKLFVDNKVYSGLADSYRKKLEQKQRGRIDKGLYKINAQGVGMVEFSPIESGNVNARVQDKGRVGMSGLSRNVGVRRGQFD